MSSPDLLPVAILAGGLATRLRPITETIPKALVSVAGEPFIFHQLRYLKDQGVQRVVLCTGHLGEQIADAVGDGSNFGLSIDISPDGEKLLGTGGALKRALPKLGEEFFVLYGDSFLPCDFGAVENSYRKSAKPALMTVLMNDNQWDNSNVVFVDGCLQRYNKTDRTSDMNYIDYGLGVIKASLFSLIEAGSRYDLADLYAELSAEGQLAGYEVTERFYEIGSHAGLAETEHYFTSAKRGDASNKA